VIKSWLNLCLAILTAGSFYANQASQGGLVSASPVPGEDALSGSYSIIVNGYDWGSAVCGTIIKFDKPVKTISPEQFFVVEEKQTLEHGDTTSIVREQRPVSAAFLCDENGTAVDSPSCYVSLELEVGPQLGSALCFFPDEQHYRWANPYRLVIELAPGQRIQCSAGTYSRLAVSRASTGRVIPLANTFRISQYTGLEHTFSFASYSPARDGSLHPLVIWLHGLGEGGSDINLPLLGSNVAALAGEAFQTTMNGAYVLVPQSPTMWLDDGSGQSTTTGNNCYVQDLMLLIRQFIATNPGIDPNRIYIGGCSNGGYMTLSLLLEYPTFFAAAFPVCEAYQDNWLTEDDIALLSQIPMWFVHSELDQICPPQSSTFPTVERLRQAGSPSVHLTRLTSVHDTTGLYTDKQGRPYQYDPHCAWIPVLNDQCTDPTTGQTLFQWLAQQSR